MSIAPKFPVKIMPILQAAAFAAAMVLGAHLSHQLAQLHQDSQAQYVQTILLTNATQNVYLALSSVQARLVHITPPVGVAPAAVGVTHE